MMGGIQRVAVIGAGTMGNGIAHIFAVAGHDLTLIDLDRDRLEAALQTIARNMERQERRGTLDAGARDTALARITTATELAAADEADFIVEAVSEDLALKARIFHELDQIAPQDTVLASNTSSISITALAGSTRRPEQVIGMHFMNPVPVMELVEVIRGLQTSDQTTSLVLELAGRLGKTAVEANDRPGFISNRILMPMINEAIFCLQEGVADAESIDTVMRLGMNHPMGPLALADLIGLDTCLAIMEVLQREIGDDKYRPSPILRNYVAAGWLGKKSGRGFYQY